MPSLMLCDVVHEQVRVTSSASSASTSSTTGGVEACLRKSGPLNAWPNVPSTHSITKRDCTRGTPGDLREAPQSVCTGCPCGTNYTRGVLLHLKVDWWTQQDACTVPPSEDDDDVIDICCNAKFILSAPCALICNSTSSTQPHQQYSQP